jgi:acyl-CoA dehydrogenase
MNFDFSDEQKELQAQANRFLTDQCPATVPRSILESDAPYARELWEGIAEMGFLGTAIPEEYGGVGFGYLELCLIAQEMGRAVVPVPFSSSVYLASEAILRAGSEEQKQNYLPRLASGEIIGTLAIAEGFGTDTNNLSTSFDGGSINGTKNPVVDGDIADIAIVVSKDGLAIVDLNGDGVQREAVTTVDPTRSHATIAFSNASGEALGDPDDGNSILEDVFNRAAILFAFEQVGGADACLAMSKSYAGERFAFGRAIGSFQALKHKMADMYVKTELARSNAYFGAMVLNENAPELPVAAAAARVSATEAYHFASKENIQIHGGIGFTWEYDAQFFYRRSKLLALNIGGPLTWKEKLICALETAETA